MTLFKCKMCGGTLNINRSETVATCEYCGTQQTLPKLNEDRKINLYDRANHFRRNNEFDKATDMYEQILNEDNTDAEAYWSLVLCRFGIEYVEDPTSHKRIPTVNRAQFTSVFDDDNYKSALQHADIMQRRIYEEEATIINDIQKGILAISQKADPFDIFICYKENDSNGKRTPDSVLAQELYYQLKQEGFRVFFSRITLEDKLGSAYEPYIFAALNSAKVMVVLGTKPEFFNAVWVKNEWSRYLALIKKGQEKTLIPAYKDMDPYDLPEEFSHLQAQDMSKLGFMQDLIRGIKKITKREDPKPGIYKTQTVREAAPSISGTTDAGILPILKRAFLFLEDGNWISANEYCEKVLDRDPENAQAYLGKLMVELHVKKQEELEALPKPFDQYGNYQKAIRFGDEDLRATLTGYVEHINTRNETARLEESYGRAMREMRAAKNEAAYQNAAQLFKSVSGYKNADILADQCQTKAEEARKDAILASAEARMGSSSIANQERAIALLQSIPGWKDADRLVTVCQQRIEEIKAKAEADRIERAQRAQIFAKRAKRVTLITASVCLLIALAILLHSVIIPNVRYNNALALMEDGKYEEAISKFEKLDDFKDSAQKIAECNQGILEAKYTSAIELMKAGKYEEAKALFLTLKDFKQSAQMIRDCELMPQYHTAVQLMNENKYEEALPILEALGDYRDCPDRIKECIITLYGQEIWDKVADVSIGDIATMGTYEQDNDTSNGSEKIEWQVLAKKGTKVLLLSTKALDAIPYHEMLDDVTWETSTVREWLNDYFLNHAFSEVARAEIQTVTVTADKASDCDTNPGNATEDKVFLLSAAEAETYFSSASARKCTPTAYASAQGVHTNSNDPTCVWWLRSPGAQQNMASIIGLDGKIYTNGASKVNSQTIGIRPAIWVDLNHNAKNEALYNQALQLMNAKEYKHAYQLFNNIDYKDSSERAQECLNLYLDESYTEAMSLFNAGKYEEAKIGFLIPALYGYKDSEAKIEECNNAIYGEEVWDKIKNTNVGDIIKFGKYEQDNDRTNGKEDIEWQVLYKEGSKVLVISKNILDWQQYHTSDTDVTWETSSLRQWLNSTFLNDAFSSAEQSKIPTATVTADKNPKKDTNPGNATQDRIFLLSYEEAEKYFDSKDARICLPTDYARANGAYTGEAYGSNGSVWWLRTPGGSQKEATWVFWDGGTNYLGQNATFNMGIRPVMWIDLSEIA